MIWMDTIILEGQSIVLRIMPRHGDIGLDNRILASHATNRDVDDYKYDWNDSSRGRYNVKGCVKPTVNEQYSRLREAWDKSVAYFITFSYLLTEYL